MFMINLYASHYIGVSKTFHLASYLLLTLQIPSEVLFELVWNHYTQVLFRAGKTLRKLVLDISEIPFYPCYS